MVLSTSCQIPFPTGYQLAINCLCHQIVNSLQLSPDSGSYKVTVFPGLVSVYLSCSWPFAVPGTSKVANQGASCVQCMLHWGVCCDVNAAHIGGCPVECPVTRTLQDTLSFSFTFSHSFLFTLDRLVQFTSIHGLTHLFRSPCYMLVHSIPQ